MRFSDSVAKLSGTEVKNGVRLGIELEYEGAKTKTFEEHVPGWVLTQDASLRNHGIEFVSHITLPDHLHTRLSNAEEVVQRYKLDPHKRCGVHVHLNMTDMTIKQLWCVSTLYALLEPQIFQFFAPDRTDNHFCVPLYYCENMLTAFTEDARMLRENETKPKRKSTRPKAKPANLLGEIGIDMMQVGRRGGGLSIIGQCSKYSALNLKTLGNLGTIEFRHLPATTDFMQIEAWCMFICTLREEALKYDDPEDIIIDYEQRGVEGLLGDVGLLALDVDKQDQSDAEYLALTICGHPPVPYEKLKWNIGGA